MPAPTIRLATDDDMRAITSRNLDEIPKLPHLYISAGDVDIPLPPLDMSTDGVDLMRAWGVANVRSIADYARLFPAALIAPKDFGQFVDRSELLYNGAEPAADHVAALQSKPGSTAFE